MFHAGKIFRRARISPTVIRLDIDVPFLSFSPGQWVDFVVKPNEWVGGFSIASSPRDLPRITLAVKISDHAPATWVHDDDRCTVGLPVELRVGGDAVLAESIPLRPAVFCAGGIGISPILSQYREFIFLRDKANARVPAGVDAKIAATMLLYSVSSASELVFGEELAELSQQGSAKGYDKMVFAFTKETHKNSANTPGDVIASTVEKVAPPHVEHRSGRILVEFLNDSPHDADFYICGPPSMINDAVHHLSSVRGVPLERIKFEKWW